MKTAMLSGVLFLAVTVSGQPATRAAQPTEKPAGQLPGARGRELETLHLGGGRKIVGHVIKHSAATLFVDLGFDILKVPVASVVRREKLAAGKSVRGNVVDEEVFFRADRPQKTIAEGAAEVGQAVVKIESSTGQGSGFITTKDGYIVTNFHVVQGDAEVSVTLYLRSRNGFDLRTVRKVKVIAANPHVDLALIKMTPPKGVVLEHVFIGVSEKMKVGDKVYAIGTPVGLERSVSEGMVSVTNRTYSGFTHFQITAAINPGNSGGPLFNLRGEVVGVNCSEIRGMEGLNFSIPGKYVVDFLRNRDAFAVDTTRNENGVHYMPGPRRPKKPARKHEKKPEKQAAK